MVKRMRPSDEKDGAPTEGARIQLAQEALQAERDRAQQYLDIAGVILVALAPDQTITLINKKGCELLGYPHKDLIGKNWFDLIIPKNESSKVKAVFGQLMKGEVEPVENVENYVVTGSGEKRLIYWHNTLIRDAEGSIAGTLSSGEDITERKRAEEMIKEKEARLRSILENTHAGYFYVDTLGQFQYVNDAWLRMHGYESRAEVIGQHISLTQIEADVEGAHRNVEKLLAGHPIPAGEFTRRCKDGSVKYHTFSANPVILGGVVAGLEGFIIDTTAQKQAEEELRKSEDLLRFALDSIETGEWDLNLVDHTAHRSLRHDQIFGYETLLPRWTFEMFLEHVIPEDRAEVKRKFQQAIESKGDWNFECRITRKDGEQRWILASGRPRLDPGGQLYRMAGIVQDITERKRLEEEQRKVAKLESIGILAAGIAHNFNNILTAVLGNISLAKMDTKPGSETHEMLEQAEKASLRAKDLTAQLLTFSKGGAPVRKIASLTELLTHTADFALHGSNVKCHFSIAADLRQSEIDPAQVSQVIHNLVVNAQQAMPAGGAIELRAENISIGRKQDRGNEQVLEAGDYVRITVTDHGDGIPDENMHKIFDPFFTTKIRAIGLGLATSFSIVRRHGGHISVISKPGSGSTVNVYLPVARESGGNPKS